MLRYLAVAIAAVIAITIAIALNHPPMRLMPAPQVFLRDGSNPFSYNPDLPDDTRIEFYYATNRLPVGPRSARIYTVAPDRDLHLGTGTIRVGEIGMSWDWLYGLSTSADEQERPFLNLENMREDASITETPLPPEAEEWFARVDAAVKARADRDVIVYVHGANTTVERAAGQAAQLMHFTGRNSVVILFAWPTAENFLRYPRDIQTAYGAAPQLARIVRLLSERTGVENVDVFTYSAGGTVGSDGMALLGRDPGDSLRLGEVYHAAPDADFRGFVDDLKSYSDVARRVSVAVNLNDSALRLAQIVNRGSRAGRPDMAELTPEATEFVLAASRDQGLEVIQVRPENIPGLSKTSHTFWYDDPWVSSDVLLTLTAHLPPAARGLEMGAAEAGTRYWTFTPDYPERLAAALAALGH